MMTFRVLTPYNGWVTVAPEPMTHVCPVLFPFPHNQPHEVKMKVRRWLAAEGWIDLAENRLDPWPDKETVDFIESV